MRMKPKVVQNVSLGSVVVTRLSVSTKNGTLYPNRSPLVFASNPPIREGIRQKFLEICSDFLQLAENQP